MNWQDLGIAAHSEPWHQAGISKAINYVAPIVSGSSLTPVLHCSAVLRPPAARHDTIASVSARRITTGEG